MTFAKALTLTEAAELKGLAEQQFAVSLHFHDACGGQYFSFDEVPSDEVLKHAENFFRNMNYKIQISDDKLSFYIKEKINA